MREIGFADLTASQAGLLESAAAAMETAYAPYSGFLVGAALLATDGEVVNGSNVENAAYGSTICAERAALVRANAMGIRSFESVAVIARGRDRPTSEATAPCGACRQMLFEAVRNAGRDIEVILASTDKEHIVITSVEELLPMGFGPASVNT